MNLVSIELLYVEGRTAVTMFWSAWPGVILSSSIGHFGHPRVVGTARAAPRIETEEPLGLPEGTELLVSSVNGLWNEIG